MREPISFGRYLLLDRIDVGGMGEVFLARVMDGEGAGRLVAMKRLLPSLAEDPELVAMFLDEARIAVQLDHPGVVRIEDLGQHGVIYFIVMEYVPGKDLKALLDLLAARGERIPVPLAVWVTVRVLEALGHAHEKRDALGRELAIVHRDVSPRNVLLSFAGEVKLIDFGLASARARGLEGESGAVRGKPAYMSPEQARGGPVDCRADVFAVGVMLCEMLTGARGVAGERGCERARTLLDAPHVPPALARAVRAALASDPADRPASAAALAQGLAPHCQGVDAAALGSYLAGWFPDEVARERARS